MEIEIAKEKFTELVSKIDEISLMCVEIADIQNALDHNEIDEDNLQQSKDRLSKLNDLVAKKKEEIASIMKALYRDDRSLIGSSGTKTDILIPNLNTLSTLLDRLCIENVKLFHFVNYSTGLDDEKIRGLESLQKSIISSLSKVLVDTFYNTYVSGEHNFIIEERTFK